MKWTRKHKVITHRGNLGLLNNVPVYASPPKSESKMWGSRIGWLPVKNLKITMLHYIEYTLMERHLKELHSLKYKWKKLSLQSYEDMLYF